MPSPEDAGRHRRVHAGGRDVRRAPVRRGRASSAAGARVEVARRRHRVIDGPFAEAKELIAGFAILDVGSLAEAVEHARKFALLVGSERVDVRKVIEFATSSRPCPPSSSDRRRPSRPPVAALWRVESPRVIARLVRLVGDLDTAEELAQDTFVAALERWRADGIPDNPAAWLTTTARLPRDRTGSGGATPVRTKYRSWPRRSLMTRRATTGPGRRRRLADDLLGLVFMSCHPSCRRTPGPRSPSSSSAGCSTAEVARAFLAPEPTIAQRIVRAKRTLAAANIRFELPGQTSAPPGSTRSARSSTSSSTRAMPRRAATMGPPRPLRRGLRLGRMLASLTPRDPERSDCSR